MVVVVVVSYSDHAA